MKQRAWWIGLGAAFLLATAGLASGEAPPAKRDPASMTVADITACMRANIVDRGSLREIELRSTDASGDTRKLRFKLFWKPAKEGAAPRTVLRVVEPAEYAGAAILAISKPEGDEIYMYVPALDRVQRVKGDENRSLFGTDFSYADVAQVQALAQNSRVKRIADEKVLGRDAFVLDVATDMETSGYTRIKSYVDQATCTLLKSEFFVVADEPKKVLEADLSTLVEIDPWWLVLGYSMENTRTKTRTELTLSNVYLLEQLPEALFDPATFHRIKP